MAELKETKKEYYIPDNFIEEGRIFQGKIRVRYLIEGAILAIGFAIIGIAIITANPTLNLEWKIGIMAILCAPPMIVGVVGFNGDPISVAAKSAINWTKNKQTMLYNPNPKLLKRDPMLTVMNQTKKVAELMNAVETKRQETVEKKVNINIVEGEDYVFAEDEYVDAYTKRLRPQQVKNSGSKKTPAEKEYLIAGQKRRKAASDVSGDDFNADEDIFGGSHSNANKTAAAQLNTPIKKHGENRRRHSRDTEQELEIDFSMEDDF